MTRIRAEILAEQIIGRLEGWVLYSSPGRKFSFLPNEPRRHIITNGKRGKQRWSVEASSWPGALRDLRELKSKGVKL
jgi:hypothetical protein